MVGGLEVVHHTLETADRGLIKMLLFVEAADLHLFACKMVEAQVDLQACVARIGAVGEAVYHFAQRVHRLLGAPLVALNVGDLLVIAEGTQIVGIGHVAMCRMQLDKTVQRADGVSVLVLQVLGVALHQRGVHRPGRIRVVLFHRIELIAGSGPPLGIQRVDAVVVQLLYRAVGPVASFRRPRKSRTRQAAATVRSRRESRDAAP